MFEVLAKSLYLAVEYKVVLLAVILVYPEKRERNI